jgi:hypothetical protein
MPDIPDELKQQLTRIEDKLGTMSENLTKVLKTIYGTNGSPGMRIVVDRLNQQNKSQVKREWLMWTTIVGMASAIVITFIIANLF